MTRRKNLAKPIVIVDAPWPSAPAPYIPGAYNNEFEPPMYWNLMKLGMLIEDPYRNIVLSFEKIRGNPFPDNDTQS